MPVIGGFIADVAAEDAALAKRAPRPRKVDVRVKPLKKGLRYDGGRTDNPDQWPMPALYDYDAVRQLLDVESIFAKTCWKYVEQIWSRGWEVTSRANKSSEYVKARFKQIAYVSGIPTFELFSDIAIQAVVYSNVYIQKVRKATASGGQVRFVGGRRIEPVAAYVVLDTPTVRTVRNPYGVPLKYIQDIRGKLAYTSGWETTTITPTMVEIDPKDMIHLTFHRQAGFSEGTPMVIPVIDDIAALRRMEETAEIIAFQASIPIYHFTAGTPEPGMGGTPAEVDDLEDRVNNMLAHGSLVTNERCGIEIKQADADITTILEFIDYYKRRVLSGLGVSPVLMGESGTSNRDTSLVVANEMQQTTRMLQRCIAEMINSQIIDELLLEGGVDIFDDYYTVKLYIPEIDAASERANQIHGLALYEGGAITESAFRHTYLGTDPITDEERDDMFLSRITIPKIEAQGYAKGLGDPETTAAAEKKIKSVVRPQNQHGSFSRPSRIAKRDELLALARKVVTTVEPDINVWLSSLQDALGENLTYNDRLTTSLRTSAIILRNSQLNDVRNMTYDDIINTIAANLIIVEEE